MIEKRFTSDVDVFSLRKIICDNKTNREYFNEVEEYDNDIEKIILVLNEQHETIQRLEAQLSHIEYRFTEYRNKTLKEIKEMEIND